LLPLDAGVAGWAAGCGVLLAVAGASKVYRGVRGVAGETAIRRALRVSRRRWRVVEPAAGGVECAVGVVVCAGVLPAVGGAVMAGLGAAFCGLLGYARIRGLPGGCGCIEWRPPAAPASRTVSWREIARSAVVLGAGIALAATAPSVLGTSVLGTSVLGTSVLGTSVPGPSGLGWFGAGLLAAGVVLILLSVRAPWRTPVCHRPLWRPARSTLRALTGHGVYLAMAASAGPLGPLSRHHRTGCADEFWFTAPDGGGEQRAVVFLVRYGAPGGALAVRASVRDPQAG
jgi:hypothetical protein